MAEKISKISSQVPLRTLKVDPLIKNAVKVQGAVTKKLPGPAGLGDLLKIKPKVTVPAPVQDQEQPGSNGNNPFKELPYPSPGDRIKADDFKKLSQSLQILYDIHLLSSTLCGRDFGEVKLALVTQQYEIQRVMSVFGTEIGSLEDEKLDQRKVIQVLPVEPGEPQVIVILTEAVETRRTVPNLLGKTYKDAAAIVRSALGDGTYPAVPIDMKDLMGYSLAEVKKML